MADPRPVRKYNCTQDELYAICAIGWNSYAENQADFLALNTTYTVALGTAALAAVQAAKDLPGEQARGEAPESARIALKEAADIGLHQWRILRSHISKAFPGALFKPKVEAAGGDKYDLAMANNWESVDALLNAGLLFLTDNTAALTAAGMPPAFVADYTTARANFAAVYTAFKTAEQSTEEGTDEKIIANNDLYDDLLSMFDDGQLIYEKNASKRDRFILAKVKSLVTPGGGIPENILATLQGFVAAGMKVNLGALPAGTAKARMKALAGGPLEFGLSVDGLNFNGNTTTMSAGAETTYSIADFASIGTTFVVFNQNGSAQGEYKVEFIA